MGWAKREYTARQAGNRGETYSWWRAPSRWLFRPEPRPADWPEPPQALQGTLEL